MTQGYPVEYMMKMQALYRYAHNERINKNSYMLSELDRYVLFGEDNRVIRHTKNEPMPLTPDEQLSAGLETMQTFVSRFGSFLADDDATRREIRRRTKKLVLPDVSINDERRRVTVFDQLGSGLHCMIEMVDEQGAADDTRTIHLTKSYAGEVFVLHGDLADDAPLGSRQYSRLIARTNRAIEQYFGRLPVADLPGLTVDVSINDVAKAARNEQRRRVGRRVVQATKQSVWNALESYGKTAFPQI